jgi:hypothetical protein
VIAKWPTLWHFVLSQSRVWPPRWGAPEPFRDDALRADLLHGPEELPTPADHVIDIDNPRASGFIEHLPKKRLALLDRAAAQAVTFLLPALDLVAVVNAGLYRSPMQAWVPLVVLNRYVLAAAH